VGLAGVHAAHAAHARQTFEPLRQRLAPVLVFIVPVGAAEGRLMTRRRLVLTRKKQRTGLPDGVFSNPKYQFGKILEGLVMEDVGKFYGHLVYFTAI
jgi:hypothetical protein